MKTEKHHIVHQIKVVLFCVFLVLVGLTAVWGITVFMESKRPLLDLSQRSETAESAGNMSYQANRLRFAVATMVCVEDTFCRYQRLISRICRAIGSGEAFVLRPSYAEVRQGLEDGKVDVAFVCTGTYIHSLDRGRIKLLVQPEFMAGLAYRSLLIVPASSSAQRLEDLRGLVIAFTDPESNTGCLVPSAELADRGIEARRFFRKIVFTGSHDRSIMAAALATVDAAAVDSLILDSMIERDQDYAKKVKVIWESEAFGPPPIVVPVGLDEALEERLRQAFLALHEDDQGREILAEIGIERFVPADERDYLSVIDLYRRFQLKDAGQ